MADDPLRILMVLRAPVGGLYRHVIDLTSSLVDRGHAVGLVMDSLTGDAQTDERLEGLSDRLAFGVHRIPMPRLLGPGDFTATSRVRALVQMHDVQILHGHGAKGGFSARFSRLGRNTRVALYTPHGGVLNYRPGSLTGKVLRGIEATMLNFTDGVIFESAFAQSAFEKQIAPVPCLRPVVHNGLRDDEFAALPSDGLAYDFAYVGELRAMKGLDHLLEAMVQLRRPDGQPVRLILGGGGAGEERLKALAGTLGIGARTDFVGVKPARDVFAQARCVVLPSLAESLPYVLLEAAAASRPIVSTNVGGISEIFGPTSEHLVAPGDTASLRDAMQKAIDRPEELQRQADERFLHVRASFSLSQMVEGIVKTYRSAIAIRAADFNG